MREKQVVNGCGNRRRRCGLQALIALFAAVLFLSAAPKAWGAEREGTLTIRYLDPDGEPVAGAEFSLRLIAEPEWDRSFRSLLSVELDAETEPSSVAEMAEKLPARTFSTAADGICRIDGLAEGLYLVEETLPAEGHFASVPFFATIPAMREDGWNYDVEAEPKPLAAGSLRVKKTVTGAGGETGRKFSFRIRIGADGEFPVAYSTGEEGMIQNEDIIALRHGDYATVSMLPAGAAYEVEELEAGEDGYDTAASGEKGNIEAKRIAEAAFVNDRQATPTPGVPRETPSPTPSIPPQVPPQTGDPSNAGLYVFLGLAAITALVFVFFRREKK